MATDDQNRLELSDLIGKLRDDLQIAMEEGHGHAIQFRLDTVELELKVRASQEGAGKAGIKFYVFSGEGSAKVAQESVQTIKLKLAPLMAEPGPDGSKQVKIAGVTNQRPGGPPPAAPAK